MVEIFPKVSVIGVSPLGITLPFRQIYGVGIKTGYLADYVTNVTISSSDMNLISPPGNPCFRFAQIWMVNTSTTTDRTGAINDFSVRVPAGGGYIACDTRDDTCDNLLTCSRDFNYISTSSEAGLVYICFYYYFLTNLIDYARFGVWSTDNFYMTMGNPFKYVDFSTTSTSYADILRCDLRKSIKLKKLGFWLGLWVSTGTGYLRAVISEDGQTWTTLWETSTSSTSEAAVKVPFEQEVKARYIKLQAYNTVGGTTYVRVRELHFWGDPQW